MFTQYHLISFWKKQILTGFLKKQLVLLLIPWIVIFMNSCYLAPLPDLEEGQSDVEFESKIAQLTLEIHKQLPYKFNEYFDLVDTSLLRIGSPKALDSLLVHFRKVGQKPDMVQFLQADTIFTKLTNLNSEIKLAGFLNSDNSIVRWAGINIIGYGTIPKASDFLVYVLRNDNYPIVLVAAINCLEQRKDAAGVQPLVDLIHNHLKIIKASKPQKTADFEAIAGSVAVLEASIKALGEIGDPAAVDSLGKILLSPDLSIAYLKSYQAYLGGGGITDVNGYGRTVDDYRIPIGEYQLPVTVKYYAHRIEAAKAIGKIGNQQAIHFLTLAQSDSNPDVKENVTAILSYLLKQGSSSNQIAPDFSSSAFQKEVELVKKAKTINERIANIDATLEKNKINKIAIIAYMGILGWTTYDLSTNYSTISKKRRNWDWLGVTVSSLALGGLGIELLEEKELKKERRTLEVELNNLNKNHK